jgi:hypothetical protein
MESVFAVADVDGEVCSTGVEEIVGEKGPGAKYLEAGRTGRGPETVSPGEQNAAASIATQATATVLGVNRPFFYVDVASAVESAMANVGVAEQLSEEPSVQDSVQIPGQIAELPDGQ